jgi:hypothetical protein
MQSRFIIAFLEPRTLTHTHTHTRAHARTHTQTDRQTDMSKSSEFTEDRLRWRHVDSTALSLLKGSSVIHRYVKKSSFWKTMLSANFCWHEGRKLKIFWQLASVYRIFWICTDLVRCLRRSLARKFGPLNGRSAQCESGQIEGVLCFSSASS